MRVAYLAPSEERLRIWARRLGLPNSLLPENVKLSSIRENNVREGNTVKHIQEFLNILVGVDEISHQLQTDLRQMIADMEVMSEALNFLVLLKYEKERHGETDFYLLNKEAAWGNAKAARILANKYKPLWEDGEYKGVDASRSWQIWQAACDHNDHLLELAAEALLLAEDVINPRTEKGGMAYAATYNARLTLQQHLGKE